MLAGDPAKDKAAKFYWRVLPELWAYAANRIGEVSESLVEIDRAMEAGFNWEMGPFAMWDAVGVYRWSFQKMREEGMAVPEAVENAAGERVGRAGISAETGRNTLILPSGTLQIGEA